MSQPTINLNERRQERAVQQVRVYIVTEILVGGKWIASKHELAPGQALEAPTPAPQAERRPAPPMTMGRDPAKFLITIGKKFKGLTIDQAANTEGGMNELFDFAAWGREQDEPSASLEVLCEMIEAYLVEREFVPTPKNKTPRRETRGKPGDWGGGRG